MKKTFDFLEEASVSVLQTLKEMKDELSMTNKIAVSVTVVNVITLVVLMITLW